MSHSDDPEFPNLPLQKQLADMTEEERRRRTIERFSWDMSEITWDPHPDDVDDTPLTPTAPPV